MIVSAFIFGLMGLLIKLMGTHFRVWDIAAYRFVGGFLLLLAIFGRRENLFRPKNPKLILLRGLTGTVAFVFLVLAIHHTQLSTTTMLFYSYPAFAALIAPILFGDRVSVTEIIWIGAAFAGVIVLFGRGIQGNMLGMLMGVGSAVMAGLTVTIIRSLRENHSSVIIYFYFCLVGGIISLVPFFMGPRLPRNAMEGGMVFCIVVFAVIAQLLMNQGFKYCTSWQGGMFMTTEVIYATLFGVLLLGEPITWRFWVGGSLIVGSSLASQLCIRPGSAPDFLGPRR